MEAPPGSPSGLPAIPIRASVGCIVASINQADLLGNLAADPEFRELPDGTVLAQLRLATGRTWMDRDSGQWKEETEWHDVVVWKAEHLNGRLTNGDGRHVSGRLRTRARDKNGVTMRRTEIVCWAGAVIPLCSKRDAGSHAGAAGDGPGAPASGPAEATMTTSRTSHGPHS